MDQFAGRSLGRRDICHYARRHWMIILAAIGLALSAAALVNHLLRMPSETLLYLWLHSDALFPTHVVQEIIRGDLPLKSWELPPAPFIYPDWLIVAAILVTTGSPLLATLLFPLVNTGMMLVAAFGCSRLIGGESRQLRETCILLGAAGVLQLPVWINATDATYMMHPAFHAGTYSCSLLAVWMFLYLQRQGIGSWSSRLVLILLLINAFALGMSDLLTVLYLAAPLTAAVVIAAMFKRPAAPVAKPLLIAIWSAVLLGSSLVDLVLRRQDPGIQGDKGIIRLFEGTLIFLKQLAIHLVAFDLMHWLLVLTSVAALVYFAFQYKPAFSGFEKAQATEIQWAAFGLASVWGIVGGLIAGGSHYLWTDYNFFSHYWIPILVVPFAVGPLYLRPLTVRIPLPWRQGTAAVCSTVLVASTVLAFSFDAKNPLVSDIVDYQPPYVADVERIAKEQGLHRGLTDYWVSRNICVFTDAVETFPVISDPIIPFHWISSIDFAVDPKASAAAKRAYLPIDFVVSDSARLPRERVIARFGEPDATFPVRPICQGLVNEVMVYKSNHMQATFEAFLENRNPLAIKPGRTVPLPLDRMHQVVGHRDGDCFVADESDGAGIVAFGPYWELFPGSYRLDVELSAPGVPAGGGAWIDAGYLISQEQGFHQFGYVHYDATSKMVSLPFTIAEDELPHFETQFRVNYPGQGRIAVESMRLTWIDPQHGEKDLLPLSPGAAVPLPDDRMRQVIGHREGQHFVASDSDGPGIVAYGPYCEMLPGSYRLDVELEAKGVPSGGGAWIDAGYLISPEKGFHQFGWVGYDDSTDSVALPFTVTAEELPHFQAQFRVNYPGQGELAIKSMRLSWLGE